MGKIVAVAFSVLVIVHFLVWFVITFLCVFENLWVYKVVFLFPGFSVSIIQ